MCALFSCEFDSRRHTLLSLSLRTCPRVPRVALCLISSSCTCWNIRITWWAWRFLALVSPAFLSISSFSMCSTNVLFSWCKRKSGGILFQGSERWCTCGSRTLSACLDKNNHSCGVESSVDNWLAHPHYVHICREQSYSHTNVHESLANCNSTLIGRIQFRMRLGRIYLSTERPEKRESLWSNQLKSPPEVIPRFKGDSMIQGFFPPRMRRLSFLAVSSGLSSFLFLFISPQSHKSLEFTMYSLIFHLPAETPIRFRVKVGNLSVMPPQPLMVLAKGHRQIYLEPSKLKMIPQRRFGGWSYLRGFRIGTQTLMQER